MDDKVFLENALSAWKRHHAMTFSLLAQLSEDQLYAELPRPGLNTFAKHFEEMIEVQQDYAAAFHTHRLQFRDDLTFRGLSTKVELQEGFAKADQAVHREISECSSEQRIDIFGVAGTRADLIQTLLHHELFHHGQFSVFSHEMKFNLPKDWRDFWWIPARY